MQGNQPISQFPPFETRTNARRAQFFRPWGSNLTVWIRNQYKVPVEMVRWGGVYYVPGNIGNTFEIMVENHNLWAVAVPGYLEGAGFYTGANPNPAMCTTDEMWELKPGEVFGISGIHNPHTQETRDFKIVRRGTGQSIAEAMYRDPRLLGQCYIYERWEMGVYGLPNRTGFNQCYYIPVSEDLFFNYVSAAWRDSSWEKGMHEDDQRRGGQPDVMMGVSMDEGVDQPRFAAPESFSSPTAKAVVRRSSAASGTSQERSPLPVKQDVGVGLGAAHRQSSYVTGIQYGSQTAPLFRCQFVALRDLREALGWHNQVFTGTWQPPHGGFSGEWWTRIGAESVAPGVPIANTQVHRPIYR